MTTTTKALTTDSDILLTTEDLEARWKKEIAAGTLENWRRSRKGPPFIKFGKHRAAAVFYRLSDVIEYERKNTVQTRAG